MAQTSGSDRRSPSTTTDWEWRRVRRRPKGQKHVGARAARWGRRAKVNPREPLTLTVTYRGGPECWYEIHSRGEVGRFVGVTALHDVLQEIMLGVEYHPGGS